MSAHFQYAVSDGIAEIGLDRPPVNALSLALLEALIDALRRAAADESVRAVVLASHLNLLGDVRGMIIED